MRDALSIALMAQAIQFFDKASAEAWFLAPTCALGGRKPTDLINGEGGAGAVAGLLVQLEFGVYV